MALLVSAHLLENSKPFLEEVGHHGLACHSGSQGMLNSPPVHQGAAASSCWQERVGKACTAAGCSQGRADASAGCVQQPPAGADWLRWFNHPVVTS